MSSQSSSGARVRLVPAAVRAGTVQTPAVNEAVLSLCHYFDCAAVLSRAEDNLLLVVEANNDPTTARMYGLL